jgi:Fe-S cluster assembly protein SufD
MNVTSVDTLTANMSSLIEPKLKARPDALRKQAFETFQNLGLPGNKNEEFKHTPLTRLLEKNFKFTGGAVSGNKSAIPQFFIPGLDANVLVFINGIYAHEYSLITSPAEHLTIGKLEDALGNKLAGVEHFGKYTDFSNDSLAAWNTADWSSGYFIHVPKNSIVEKPVIIYNISDASQGEVIASQRNLIVVEKNAEVTVIQKYDSLGDGNHFLNNVTEVAVDENAGFNFYELQNDNGNRFEFTRTDIHQKNASRVNTYTFTLGGKLIRNNLHLAIDGEGIESHMYGLYLLGNDTLADNHTVVDHRKPHSFSNELYKGIMGDNSKGVFNGKIYVRPHAQKTNAFQANRNILLTDRATVNTKPQLEIWADDVKCSHGCTSGQLDEEAVFYLQSRGISKETAKAMMLYAFAGEVLDNVKHPVIKDYLDQAISERLHKNF